MKKITDTNLINRLKAIKKERELEAKNVYKNMSDLLESSKGFDKSAIENAK